MKKAILVLLILFSFSLWGCFNYRDVNRLFFTTSVIVDVDDDDNVLIYSENFKAYRGAGEKGGTEVRVLFKGKGKTSYDAYSQVMQSASFEINYSQIKAIIFTARAARYGIDNFVDALDRDQKPTLRAFLFVYEEDPEELLKITLADEQFLGLYLDNLMVSQGEIANVVHSRMDEYTKNRLIGSKVNVVPILKISKVASEQRLSTKGAAIIVNDKMVGKLSEEEVIPYNFVINEAKVGFLYADNPEIENKLVALKILGNKTKISVDYDGETVYFKKKIKTEVTMVEVQKFTALSKDEVRKQIEKNAEKIIRHRCITVFEKYKEQGIDIYNVQRHFEKRYPSEKVKDVLKITKAETDVKVHIQGSQNTTDFR